jgi:hypothetical protein
VKIIYPKTLSWIIYGSTVSIVAFMVMTAITYRQSVYWENKYNESRDTETTRVDELSKLSLMLSNADLENALLIRDYFLLDSSMLQEKFLNADINKELMKSIDWNTLLKSENENLKKQVNEFRNKVEMLIDELHESRSKLAMIQNNYDSLSKVVATSALNESNKKLTIEFLAENRLIDISATGIQKFRRLDKPTSKLRHTDYIEITIHSAQNLNFDLGEKTVYFRIADPSGNILPFMKDELDLFMFRNEEILFSEKKQVQFKGGKFPATIIYHPVTDLLPGIYWVYAFCDGIRIGEASFDLF